MRYALQSTARPAFSEDENGKKTRLGFGQAGYGFVDLDAAAKLVTSKGWRRLLTAAQVAADRRVMKSVGFAVPRSDFWTYDAQRIALEGSDARVFTAGIAKGMSHLKVTLAHPSLYVVGENQMVYTVTVRDAAGRELGTTTEAASGQGTSSLLLDLRALKPSYGVWEFEVSGIMAVSDPDNIDSESLLGRVIVLQVAQLRPLR